MTYGLFKAVAALIVLPLFGAVGNANRYDFFQLQVSPGREFEAASVEEFSSWKCFEKKYLKFKCHYNKPLKKQGSSLEISVETKEEIHSFSHSHAISGEICSEMLSEIKKILKNQRYFCIEGSNWSSEKALNKTEYFWSFRRMMTNSGNVNYFLPD